MSGETNETENQFAILKSPSFLPLFVTQAISAFNDNAVRNGIAILITFDLAVRFGFDATLFVQAGLALFMLPYFLFSAIAGQLADKHDKAILSRWIKLFDLAAMVFGALSLWLENPYMHLTVLFLAGTTAAFFGPIKYGVLPQYLRRDQLIAGNALIELGTFVTILLGTLYGGFLVLEDWGRPILAITIIVLAVVALGCAFLMPSGPGRPLHRLRLERAAPDDEAPLLCAGAQGRVLVGDRAPRGSGSWAPPSWRSFPSSRGTCCWPMTRWPMPSSASSPSASGRARSSPMRCSRARSRRATCRSPRS